MKIRKLADTNTNYFCGYYDKIPWSQNEQYLFSHNVAFNNRIPDTQDFCNICIINTDDFRIKILDKTNAWNWQQGSMLQWANINGTEYVVFNSNVDNKFKTKFVNQLTGVSENIVDKPISSLISPSNEFLSINFSRLYDLRKGYGYAGVEDEFKNNFFHKNDGIFKVNINNEYKQIISLEKLVNLNTRSPSKGYHYINHTQFNKDFSLFSFFHIVVNDKNRFIRLYVCDTNGNNLKLIHEGIISHLDWYKQDKMIAWLFKSKISSEAKNRSSLYKKIRKIFLKNKNIFRKVSNIKGKIDNRGFFWIELGNDVKMNSFSKIDDGHPVFSPDLKYLAIDSYPDGEQYQHLYLFDVINNKLLLHEKFKSNPLFKGHFRCDLHPKWDRKSKKICIDSSMDGLKNVYIIENIGD